MIPISVFIPTANRPLMLRTALNSVAAQTALANVAEVIVIENRGNRDSEKVCEEFPQLPIRYVFRDPPLPPGYQWCVDAVRRIQSKHMAILFDDDWWLPEHLQYAIESLATHPDAIAAFSTFIYVTGETGFMTEIGSSFLCWFAANNPSSNHRWKMNLTEVLVAGLLCVPFHFSTTVVLRDVWEASLSCIKHGNTYDTDRQISVELARHGPVVVDSRAHTFIRMHPGQHNKEFHASQEHLKWWRDSTRRLLELAKTEGIDLRHEFASRMSSKNIGLRTLRNQFSPHGAYDDLVKEGILIPPRAFTKQWALKYYHLLTPPVIQDAIGQFRHR